MSTNITMTQPAVDAVSPDRPEFWGACPLAGAIPKWCPRRYDNPETAIQALAETATRHNDEVFADLALTCAACKIAVQERIGVEGLLDGFMRQIGQDIVAELDDGRTSPYFTPAGRGRR